jgi:hypothetical protein
MKTITIAIALAVSVAIVLVTATDINTTKGRHALFLRAQSKKSSIVSSAQVVREAERLKAEYELLKSKPGYEELIPKEILLKLEKRLSGIGGTHEELKKHIAEYNELVFRYNNSRRPLVLGAHSDPRELETIREEEVLAPNQAL